MIELTSKQLRRAATIKDQIEKLQKELNRLLGNGAERSPAAAPAKRGRRKMSKAARLAAAKRMKAYWAAKKKKL